jgi:hypothetical protein
MIIESITRQFDEETTKLKIGYYRITISARPIRAWKRCKWSLFQHFPSDDTFRLQSPWLTLVISKDFGPHN